MERGTHISVLRPGFYTHHGIYIDDDTVIHFSKSQFFTKHKIIKSSIVEFLQDGECRLEHYPSEYDKGKTALRALEHLGKTGYNLIFNNCEHFCRLCTTGKSYSHQVVRGCYIIIFGVFGLAFLKNRKN